MGGRMNWRAARRELEAQIALGKSCAELAEHFGSSIPSLKQAMRGFGLIIDPKAAARRRAANFKMSDAHRETCRQRMKRLNADPEFVARTQAARAANGYRSKATAWIPEDLRPLYRRMCQKIDREFGAQVVREEMAKREREAAAAAERQAREEAAAKVRSRYDFDAIMARVSSGQSRLTERAVLASREHEFSLVGSTLA